MTLPGRLIVFEGADGVGKSTLARKLVDHLNSRGISCRYFAFPGHEPGTLGYHVYLLHHSFSDFGIQSICPTSLQVLHIAAHIDAIERTIVPTLESGCYIVLDRYWWSTWVYGMVSGINRRSLEKMIDLELIHWNRVLPAVVFLISRSEPFFKDPSVEKWRKLDLHYRELATREAAKHRVETIKNDRSMEEALEDLACITSQIANELVLNG